MIGNLKPYAEYKVAGLPWLERIPSSWRVARNGSLFAQRNETGREELPILEVSLKTGVRVRDFENSARKQIMSDASKYKRAAKGDLAYNMMRMWQGAVGVAPVDGLVSPAYVVARPHVDVDPQFFIALFRTDNYLSEIDNFSHGIVKDRNRLYWDQFKQICSPCPPPAEQAAIVRFLHWANGRLERAIRAKRKVIALLNEQKQAIIHRAVTRGLDPSVPLKPSGIPWLGDIPQHWTLKRFKLLARINSGQVDPKKAEYRDLVLIAPNHIQSGSGRLLNEESAEKQGADSGKYLVRRGQVIYSKIRPNLRKATIAPCNCLCSADMYPIDPTTGELSTEYLLLLLLSQPFTKFAVDTSMRVAMPKVNREALANCLMWYPGANEQSLVLQFIAREVAPIDTAISRLEREIELLREYRTRLVADVVTGKLDVRAVAARLPDEAEPTADETTSADDEDSDDVSEAEDAAA
ncbi:MAG: hypothetical protein ACKVP5_05510 [Aestuariivirga sp.]